MKYLNCVYLILDWIVGLFRMGGGGLGFEDLRGKGKEVKRGFVRKVRTLD